MSLTDHHIRLLSAYSDGEATPAEARETEALLGSSSEARAWLRDAGTLRSVSRRASDEALRRLNQTLPLTGEAIVAAAGRRGGGLWRSGVMRGPLAAGAFGVLALGALLVGEYAFDGRDISAHDIVAPVPSAPPPLAAASFSPTEEVEESAGPVEEIDEPVVAAAPSLTKRVGRKAPISPAPESSKAQPVPEPWEGIATQPFALDMEVRITLFSSSGMIIVTDDYLPQPLNEIHFRKSEDLVTMTTLIDEAVDSLNASVGRIATDRTQPVDERVRRIMIEQFRYREGIRRMIETEARRDSGTVVQPEQEEGASIDTLKDDSLMNIDPSFYQEEPRLPCPMTENCTGVS